MGYGLVAKNTDGVIKNPSKITEKELGLLIKDFETRLNKHYEIWFYYNPGRLHKVYRELLEKSKSISKITRFPNKLSHLCHPDRDSIL